MCFKRKRTSGSVEALWRKSSGQRWLTVLLGLACILNACGRAPGSNHNSPTQMQNDQASTSASIKNDNRTQDAANICDRIPEIKLLPFHRDRGVDATYDAIRDAGEAAVPCLIRKITDTTLIPDPRETLRSPDTTVGDVAYFLLIEITNLDFAQFLPPDMQEEYKHQGVFAYYKYVEKEKHRAELQNRLYEWYRQKYGKDLRHPQQ